MLQSARKSHTSPTAANDRDWRLGPKKTVGKAEIRPPAHAPCRLVFADGQKMIFCRLLVPAGPRSVANNNSRHPFPREFISLHCGFDVVYYDKRKKATIIVYSRNCTKTLCRRNHPT